MKNTLAKASCLAAVFLMGLSTTHAVTVSDDFSDLNDTVDPTWTHLTEDANPANLPSNTTFDASSGAYRITAQPNGITVSGIQYGSAGAYTGASSTDVNVKADFVQPSSGVWYGVAARLSGPNSFNALKGYAYAFEQNLSAAPGVGEMVFYKLNGLAISDIGEDGPSQRAVTLDLANKDYTFSLSIVGSTLHGSVTEVGGGVVAFQQKTDLTSPLISSGFSGVFGLAGRTTTAPLIALPIDYTIDNFSATDIPEPTTSLLAVCAAVGGLSIVRRRAR